MVTIQSKEQAMVWGQVIASLVAANKTLERKQIQAYVSTADIVVELMQSRLPTVDEMIAEAYSEIAKNQKQEVYAQDPLANVIFKNQGDSKEQPCCGGKENCERECPDSKKDSEVDAEG